MAYEVDEGVILEAFNYSRLCCKSRPESIEDQAVARNLRDCMKAPGVGVYEQAEKYRPSDKVIGER
jgi:hypothetical protein